MDRELWRWLFGSHFKDISDWNKVITRAARDKIDIVRHDFREKGIRKNLNYGHTLGHAFESFFLRTQHPVTHGQAIAAGMICEAWLSQKAYELDAEQLGEIVKMFDINFHRLPISEDNIPELLGLMRQDKKARGGILNYSLLRKIGKAIHNIEVETPLVIESLKYYINE
jgi:3-dehydroquinate synthase